MYIQQQKFNLASYVDSLNVEEKSSYYITASPLINLTNNVGVYNIAYFKADTPFFVEIYFKIGGKEDLRFWNKYFVPKQGRILLPKGLDFYIKIVDTYIYEDLTISQKVNLLVELWNLSDEEAKYTEFFQNFLKALDECI
ncbi:MAG: hypothetical protein [Caudoviricetes sp.]|nr:MAG: hypothetical protein [Caudoviricetes sp.]